MRKSWMALPLVLALCGCGGQSGAGKQARGAYQQAVASCGTDGEAHSQALDELLRLELAHPKDAAVASAFMKAYQYEAQEGC